MKKNKEKKVVRKNNKSEKKDKLLAEYFHTQQKAFLG